VEGAGRRPVRHGVRRTHVAVRHLPVEQFALDRVRLAGQRWLVAHAYDLTRLAAQLQRALAYVGGIVDDLHQAGRVRALMEFAEPLQKHRTRLPGPLEVFLAPDDQAAERDVGRDRGVANDSAGAAVDPAGQALLLQGGHDRAMAVRPPNANGFDQLRQRRQGPVDECPIEHFLVRVETYRLEVRHAVLRGGRGLLRGLYGSFAQTAALIID
jgi:hypothetical protein